VKHTFIRDGGEMNTRDNEVARLEKQLAKAREAAHWLWGFWDGNTLIARPMGDENQERIQEAFERLLQTVEEEK